MSHCLHILHADTCKWLPLGKNMLRARVGSHWVAKQVVMRPSGAVMSTRNRNSLSACGLRCVEAVNPRLNLTSDPDITYYPPFPPRYNDEARGPGHRETIVLYFHHCTKGGRGAFRHYLPSFLVIMSDRNNLQVLFGCTSNQHERQNNL